MSAREPYYRDEFVTLYHGDCLVEVTDWLAADALVTDPPYGMGYRGFDGHRKERRHATRVAGTVSGDESTGTRDDALAAWGSIRPALVFGTWKAQRPVGVRAVLIWHKKGAGGMGDLSLPWLSTHEEIYALGQGFVGRRGDAVLTVPPLMSSSRDRPDHPTPKPVGLMERLIQHTTGVVADPFVGSGSTLLAAKHLGRKAIGVEINERYCELTATRLAQDTLFGGVA